MAVNPIQFLVAQNASITDGTKTITISGNVDCSRVYSGTAIFLGGADNPAEAVAGTSPDGSGNSTITLRNNWSQGDIVNQQLVSFNTNEGLAEAISNVREIVSNVSAIEDLATQGLIKRINDNEYEVVNISAVGESLITANDASSQRSVLGLGSAATKNVGTSAGNVMEVTSTGIEVTDFSTNMPTTFSSAWGQSGVANAPVVGSLNWTALRVAGSNSNNGLELFSANGANRYFLRSESGNVYSSFSELYHSGNSVNPLDYGLGRIVSAVIYPVDDLDSASCPAGFYAVTDNTPQNGTRPAGLGIYGYIEVVRYDNGDVKQEYTDISGRKAFRVIKNGVSENWQLYYHSGNTNFNEFGGNSANDIIAVGEAVTSTVARFYFPLQSKNPVNSFTLIDTVNILKGSATIATGLTAGSITLSGLTSSKIAVLDITTSGLTVGDLLNLRTNTASVSIQFNV